MGVCEEEESVIERTEEIELELGLGFDPDHPLPSDDHPLPFDDEDVEIVNEECKNLGLEEDENLNQEKEEESVAKEEIKTKFYHPKRPGEPDCSYYLRTGTCRYGPNCRFNHPLRGKNTGRSSNSSDSSESAQVLKEEKEDFPERAGQPECKYYLRTGGCKFGKVCRYHHPREKTGEGVQLELNFLGLPIRLGEKECPFYMRTGTCKFATNCRFHHPDPTAVGGDPLAGYHNGGSLPLHPSGASQPHVPSWTLQTTSNEPAAFVDASPSYVPVLISPQGVHPNPDWNGYQVPVNPLFPPDRNMPLASAPIMNDPIKNAYYSTHQQIPVEDFPERPGQPECQYFIKNGDCKYKSACRFHHPKNRAPVCTLNAMGLPLRPDQVICSHYSRYGICKFGPACKFDHPLNYNSSASSIASASDQPTSLNKSVTLEEMRMTA